MWPELITLLLANMQQENDHLKQSTLESLGYICEEIVISQICCSFTEEQKGCRSFKIAGEPNSYCCLQGDKRQQQ